MRAMVALALVACGEGDAARVPDMDVDVAPETSPADDTRTDADDVAPDSLRCIGGCTALDGPCMRGVCGRLDCNQERISGLACDDGDASTLDDHCDLGMCRGVPTGGPGVACGGAWCPGEDAACVDGHCVRCALHITDDDCHAPRFPRLACPNMPAGVRIVARVGGLVPRTGQPQAPSTIGVAWADSTWGDSSSGWCEVTNRDSHGVPYGCGHEMGSDLVGYVPAIAIERLEFVGGTVAAYVLTAEVDPYGPVCDTPFLGGAILSIEVAP